MTTQELFIMTNQELKQVLLDVREDQWDMAMPAGTSRQPTTLGQAVRYHTYDDAWVPDVLAGKTKAEVGDQYESLLTLGDIVENYNTHNQRAIEAVRDFVDLQRVVHLSYGDYAAKEYLQHIITFRAFRSYDIAKMIGADTVMNKEFVQALLDEFTPLIEGYRQMGVFPPPIEVTDDAGPQERLLAMVGREL